MKRMKEEWDKLHPELAHFTQKQLRQQATFVASKSMTLETNLAETSEETSKPPTERLSPSQNQHANDSCPTFTRDEWNLMSTKVYLTSPRQISQILQRIH